MTGNTGCLHRSVVHPLGCKRCLAAMAKRTFVSWHPRRQGGRNMIARLAQHARVIPCMAGRTRSGDNPGMRIGLLHWRPGGGGMADFATRCGWHVVGELYVHSGIGSKVATGAVRCLGVRIGKQGQPSQTGTVAKITFLGSDRNMNGWLALRSSTIVATCASSGYACMRKRSWLPGRCRVTDIARLGRRNMRHILAQGPCSCVCAIVTSRTPSVWRRYTVMGHRGRVEGRVILVASVATSCRRDMQVRLAQRIRPVVAG